MAKELTISDFEQMLLDVAREKIDANMNVEDMKVWLEKCKPDDLQRYKGAVADYAIKTGYEWKDRIEASVAKITMDHYIPLMYFHEGLRLRKILEEKAEQAGAESGLAYEIENLRDVVIPFLRHIGYTDEQIWKMAEFGWSKFKIAATRIMAAMKGALDEFERLTQALEEATPDDIPAIEAARAAVIVPTEEQSEFVKSTISMVLDKNITVTQFRQGVGYPDRPKATSYIVAGKFALVKLTGMGNSLLVGTDQRFITVTEAEELLEEWIGG